jgi:hypothetical protein
MWTLKGTLLTKTIAKIVNNSQSQNTDLQEPSTQKKLMFFNLTSEETQTSLNILMFLSKLVWAHKSDIKKKQFFLKIWSVKIEKM